MSDQPNNQIFEIAIERIKLLSFEVNETIPPAEAIQANITLAQNLSFSIKRNAVILLLKASFSTVQTDVVFMQGVVQNIFIVKDLEKLANPADTNKITLPEELLTTILSLSISHTRAVLAQNAMGSVYQNVYIPLVKPSQMAQELFKDYMPKNELSQ